MTAKMTLQPGKSDLQQSLVLAKAGRRAEAQTLLWQVLAREPENEAAWLYLAGITTNPATAHQALNRLEGLNPHNPHLPRARAWATRQWPTRPPVGPEQPTTDSDENRQTADPAAKTTSSRETVPKPPQNWPMPLLTWGLTGMVATVVVVCLSIFLVAADNSQTLVGQFIGRSTPTTEQQLTRLVADLAVARATGDRDRLIDLLEQIYALQPDDRHYSRQLIALYTQQGETLAKAGDPQDAQAAFNRAHTLQETEASAGLQPQYLNLYLNGIKHHQRGEWAAAISDFEQIHRQTAYYPFVNEMLYSAYFNLGLMREANGELAAARRAYQQAVQVIPQIPDAPQKIEALARRLGPPPPTPPPPPNALDKQVVVDISEQRAYLYQGTELVREFIVSTGEPGRDTAVGDYQILNKIPMAYASTWNLDMPFWLGIYWSGPLQNGFHAVPTVRHTGQTMWDGYLGQRVSYGCIILSMEDAETLYEWVDIGTPVHIRY